MKTTTDITIILDRSGSMQSVVHETIQGFNTFLKEQLSVEGEARLTLVRFDHEYEVVYEALDLREAYPLSRNNYIPRGLTSLLDAIGKTIAMTKNRLKLAHNNKNEQKVIVVIITDGHENNSRFFNRAQIFKKISMMERKHDWQFVFLGANQDAIEEASHIGIAKSRAMTFKADGEGVHLMFSLASEKMKKARENDEKISFTDDQEVKLNEN
jgi:uncharacterized protein YegL